MHIDTKQPFNRNKFLLCTVHIARYPNICLEPCAKGTNLHGGTWLYRAREAAPLKHPRAWRLRGGGDMARAEGRCNDAAYLYSISAEILSALPESYLLRICRYELQRTKHIDTRTEVRTISRINT